MSTYQPDSHGYCNNVQRCVNVEWATCWGLIYTVDWCVGEGVCLMRALYYSGGRVIVKLCGRDSEMLSMTEHGDS